ncbi:MAG: UDP-3-O-acyl-N-acetylglucosamine deacetylase, partial [Gemmatimonadaceae bacterium]
MKRGDGEMAGPVSPAISRQTIARTISLEGTGLHLGLPCCLTFKPAATGAGISFVRADLPGHPTTKAHVSVAVETERRTQLGSGDAALHTVEHVLAAVAARELDDLVIEMDGPEPPILDG